MEGNVVVLITASSQEEAGVLAHALVEEKLIACTSIFPVRSVYSWKGRVEDQQEVMMVCKTVTGKLDALVKRVKALHSYEVPEIVALPILGGSEDYLNWLGESIDE